MNDTMTTPTRTEFVRPLDDRVIAGVAAGMARRLDVGPGWLRVGFVVLSFFGGLGILLYILGWLTIRQEGAQTSIAEDWIGTLEGSTAWVGLGLIVLAGVVLLGSTQIVRIDLVLAAGLFLAGVLLYRGNLGSSKSGDAPPADAPPADASAGDASAEDSATAGAVGVIVGSAGATGAGGSGSAPPTRPTEELRPPLPPPPPPRRPRSYLGRAVIAAGLIVIGAIALLDNLDVIDPGFRHYVAAGVFVIGIGLLVGTFFGRAHGLIALGLLAIPLLLVTTAIRVPLSGEWGDRVYEPASAAELRSGYELSGGQLRLDLRQVDEFSPEQPITVELGIGELLVWVPDGVDVEVNADVGIGALTLFGDETGGLGVDDTVIRTGGDGVTDLVLDVEVGIGHLEVIGTP